MDTDDIRQEWDRLAAAWERFAPFVERMARPVTQWLLGRLDPGPGETILDLAAGTGPVAAAVAEGVGETGRVVAVDLAPEMVAAIERRSLPNVEPRVMDAHELVLHDASFDGAVSRWGFMLMPRPRDAFAEVARVLRPGGRLALAVWGRPESNPWILVPGAIALSTGLLQTSDPNEPGGIFSLATPDRLEAVLEGTGLRLAETEEIEVRFRFDSFEEVWEYCTSLLSEVSRALLDAPDREAIRTRLREYLAGFAAGDGYDVPGTALAALATRDAG